MSDWQEKYEALTAERAALKARIADIEDDFHTTVAEACGATEDDRQHCACVPHLRRRIRELEGARQAGRVEAVYAILVALGKSAADSARMAQEIVAMMEKP